MPPSSSSGARLSNAVPRKAPPDRRKISSIEQVSRFHDRITEMNAPKLWIAGLSAAVLAVSGSYLWLEGMPTSVMKPAANNPAARPVPVTTGVVKDQEFAISRVGL